MNDASVGRDAEVYAFDRSFSYNLNSLFLRAPSSVVEETPKSAGTYLSLSLHERVHWMQHHGTTIGAFLSLLKAAQELATHAVFSGLSESECEQLLTVRRTTTTPLISVDRRSFALLEPGTEIGAFNNFRMFWHSLWWTHAAFYACPENFAGSSPPRKLFANAVKAAIQMTGSLPYYSGRSPGPIVLKRQEVSFVRFANEPIRTVDLLESAALVNECMFLGLVGLQADSQEARIDSSYGRALRLFASHVETEPDVVIRDSKLQATFLVLCDIALNPPVPPFVIADTIEWEDWYPPLRFLRLVQTLPTLGTFGLNTNDLHGYIADAVSLAEISNPLDYGKAFDSTALADFEPIITQKDSADIVFRTPHSHRYPQLTNEIFDGACGLFREVGAYHAYVAWVQHRFWERRRTDLQSVVFPAISWGSIIPHERGGLDTFMTDSERNPIWSTSPLIVTDESRFATGPLYSDEFVWWFALSSIGHYVLYDVVRDTGDPKLNALPAEFRSGTQLFQWLSENLAAGWGMSPWPSS